MAEGIIPVGRIHYVDVAIINDIATQLNSKTNGKVTWTTFLGAFVIGTNNIVACPYTYNNLIYVRLKSSDTMQNASTGDYTVRVFYYD